MTSVHYRVVHELTLIHLGPSLNMTGTGSEGLCLTAYPFCLYLCRRQIPPLESYSFELNHESPEQKSHSKELVVGKA